MKNDESQDLTAPWAGVFERSADETADLERNLQDLAAAERKERFLQACMSHRRRKWDAVGRALLAVILTAAVHGFADIGVCPVPLATVVMIMISGYAVNMGGVVLKEVSWYQNHVLRKKGKR